MNFVVALCRKGVLSTQNIASRRSPIRLRLILYTSAVALRSVVNTRSSMVIYIIKLTIQVSLQMVVFPVIQKDLLENGKNTSLQD